MNTVPTTKSGAKLKQQIFKRQRHLKACNSKLEKLRLKLEASKITRRLYRQRSRKILRASKKSRRFLEKHGALALS